MSEAVRLPLWKRCLEQMRAEGLGYGKVWKAAFFEEVLRTPRTRPQYSFEMMELKQAIEKEDGYYLQSSESGELWSIPQAPDHEWVCQRIERGIRRDAVRVINLRSATLLNPTAELEEGDRMRMEHNLEKAATRLVLMARQKSVVKALQAAAPKLLEKTPSAAPEEG